VSPLRPYLEYSTRGKAVNPFKSKAGVFKIVNKVTGDVWIGSSLDVEREKKRIFASLRDGTFNELYDEELVEPGLRRITKKAVLPE
jgi:hypothetical protein